MILKIQLVPMIFLGRIQYLAELSNTQVANEDKAVDEQYWYQCHQKFSEEEKNSMPSWLTNAKKIVERSTVECQNVDIDLLNISQRKEHGIVENHFRNAPEQLLMIIKGLAGSGKSFVIDAIRSLLKQCCIVTAFFGIASFNVRGKTLHSLFRLPIRGKNRHDLKGSALVTLQEDLNGIHYLIIDEFSVVGQKMLGWIDRCCRQGTGRFYLPFGGISVILVGDIAQLPPG